MADKIKIEILKGGIIKTTTDPISGPNHANAEGFLKTIADLGGGTVKIESKGGDQHTHSHEHGITHKH